MKCNITNKIKNEEEDYQRKYQYYILLNSAIVSGDIKSVKYIYQEGEKLNIKLNQDDYELILKAAILNYWDILQFFLDLPIQWKLEDDCNFNDNNIKSIKILLANNIYP